MRLEVEVLPDNAVRLSSPDVPAMVRLARGHDQLWRVFREFLIAHKGVESGAWRPKVGDGALDAILADAEQATHPATRTQARKVRESFTRLQEAMKANADAERAERERQQQLADAERQLREAEKAVARCREKVRTFKTRRKGTPLTSPGGTCSPAAVARVTVSSDAIRERRAAITAQLQAGVTSPAAIAKALGITSKTVSNDLRAMQ